MFNKNRMNNSRSSQFTTMHFLIIIFLIISSAFLPSCKSEKPSNEKTIISVSILPQKYFLEKIAGDLFTINVIIPPGASPATYDPAPKQIIDLAKSKVYFKIGYIEFEKNWINHFVREYPNLIISDLSSGISILSNKHDHGDHWHEPHIWMSTHNAEIIAKNILSTLKEINPENTKYFESNYQSFLEELKKIDEHIAIKTTSLAKRDFIIYHPALTYFANEYDLNQISIEHEGKEPTPVDMSTIIDFALENEIKTVFIQKQFDKENAEQIAKEINGNVVSIDPLAYNWSQQLKLIADILSNNDN